MNGYTGKKTDLSGHQVGDFGEDFSVFLVGQFDGLSDVDPSAALYFVFLEGGGVLICERMDWCAARRGGQSCMSVSVSFSPFWARK